MMNTDPASVVNSDEKLTVGARPKHGSNLQVPKNLSSKSFHSVQEKKNTQMLTEGKTASAV
jgi:hypothetical protein